MKMNRGSILAASISLCCFSSAVQAGGFALSVQSASGGGNAATGHAMAEDASVMFYNPALLSSIEGTQVNAGLSITHADLNIKNTGSTLPLIAGGTPVIGDNSVDPSTGTNDAEPGGLSVVPSMFYKRDFGANNKFAFGLGVNVPFGVATEYEDDSFARYESTESGLTTVNINPAISWRANDKWDFGAGLNLQYGHAILSKSIDATLACAQLVAVNVVTATQCGEAGLTSTSNASTDSSISVEASGIAFGANIGAAYRPTASTTISLGYRSAVDYELEGDADFTHKNLGALTDPLLDAVGLGDQDATADIKLPASASLAFATKVNRALTLHGDVTWTQWSTVPEIRIVFPDTAQSDSVTSLEWEDTVRVGAGLTYQLNPKTKLRGGIAFDPTPTPSAERRTPRAPRSDSYWFAIGASHQYSKKMGFDASIAYVSPEDTTINYRAPGATADAETGYFTRGDVEADAISVALSVNYKF